MSQPKGWTPLSTRTPSYATFKHVRTKIAETPLTTKTPESRTYKHTDVPTTGKKGK